MAETKLCDSILHIKSQTESGEGNVEKVTFPITRWENVIGAPRVVNADKLDATAGAAYVLYCANEISLSDADYASCYGTL